jgi:hypothetical protein
VFMVETPGNRHGLALWFCAMTSVVVLPGATHEILLACRP